VASSALPVELEDVTEAELNLLTPVIDREGDPLAWWKVQMINFLQLCKIANQIIIHVHKAGSSTYQSLTIQ